MQADARALAAIADALDRIAQKLEVMDRAQDALLVNGHSLQDQQQTLMGLLTRLVELVTPQEAEQEGPTLSDLLARMIAQQGALYDLQRHTLDAIMRLEQRRPEATPGSAQ
ncbi:hypothetical protein MPC4_110068 [Methylocella tundrae]|uniref:Uncharacterized protein n=1 Tax=Methylocella tundrae TaxID=227605 RepID=A0A8B6M1Q8_METTU|nr:hypothetical protein [Methylocella tundrae]VTZ26119.1 conserved hypothetical protein [Methylocella tundrae]VTZ48768.1 hypothetical protein MPC4_110068 [Methylocella tundrae]